MTDRRRKNANWQLDVDLNGAVPTQDAHLAVLMDIRDELKQLNDIFGCYRFRRMSDTIERIDRRIAQKVPIRKSK